MDVDRNRECPSAALDAVSPLDVGVANEVLSFATGLCSVRRATSARILLGPDEIHVTGSGGVSK
jgi:hypothetical protein